MKVLSLIFTLLITTQAFAGTITIKPSDAVRDAVADQYAYGSKKLTTGQNCVPAVEPIFEGEETCTPIYETKDAFVQRITESWYDEIYKSRMGNSKAVAARDAEIVKIEKEVRFTR